VSDDRHLRELFRAGLREDSAGAPAFRELRRRSHPRSDTVYRVRLQRPVLAALVILLAITVAYLRRGAPEPPPVTQSLLSDVSWNGPTDFLLETPGRELLRSTPQIGAPLPIEVGPLEPKKGART
jgi:hypothetical protein